jgi:spermidine synthase
VRFDPKTQITSVFNGAVVHGAQFQTPEMRATPLTYYHGQSAVALAEKLLREHRGDRPIRIGAVGLGAGSVAAYARDGDEVIYYELDPKMRDLAQQHFTYLKDCPASQRIEMGDARLTLQRQPPQNFDLLIVDAFSGDSIPVHLLTAEAGRLYFKHLKPDGVLLIHCSNRYLNLWRVVDDLGAALDVPAFNVYSGKLDLKQFIFRCNYVAISQDPWLGDAIAKLDLKTQFPTMSITKSFQGRADRAWTDDYSNVISTLYFTSPPTAR